MGNKNAPGKTSGRGVYKSNSLPAKMGKRLISLRHLMNIIPLPNRTSLPHESIHQFGRQRLTHWNTFPGVRESCQPAHRQSGLPIHRNFHWNLVSCTTNPASLGFDTRFSIVNRALKNVQSVNSWIFFRQNIHRPVNNFLRNSFFPTPHDHVDQAPHQRTIETRVGLS